MPTAHPVWNPNYAPLRGKQDRGQSAEGRVPGPHSAVGERSRRKDVVDNPLSSRLPEFRAPHEPGGDKHLMRGLQNALEMRGIPLDQRDPLRELCQVHSPGHDALRSGYLDEAVQPSGHRRRQREIVRRREHRDVTGREIGAKLRRKDDARFSWL